MSNPPGPGGKPEEVPAPDVTTQKERSRSPVDDPHSRPVPTEKQEDPLGRGGP